jgi:choline dehydrogenase-like flavoprotein
LRSAGDPVRENLHTLAQVFLEIRDRTISEHGIHLQLYTYNPLFRDKLRSVFGWAPMLSRFAAIQGYLHSSDADAISGRAVTDRVTGRMKVYLHGRTGARAAETIRKVRAKLRRHGRQLGFVPLPGTLRIGSPGDGNHIGGTFPMAAAPKGHATDTLGRLPGYSRLHIVDASVLPTLAATTLTFTAMANARRIAVAAAKMHAGSE